MFNVEVMQGSSSSEQPLTFVARTIPVAPSSDGAKSKASMVREVPVNSMLMLPSVETTPSMSDSRELSRRSEVIVTFPVATTVRLPENAAVELSTNGPFTTITPFRGREKRVSPPFIVY
jgi:hypothetical protein